MPFPYETESEHTYLDACTGHYGIMDPDDVRAAVIDENGSLLFINGSVEGSEDGMQFTGAGFSRTPYKGFEPQFDEFNGRIIPITMRQFLLIR